MKIAIPCHIAQITPEEEERLQELFRRFGNARRRAYNLRRKGYSKSEIEKQLQIEHDLNSRYAKDAYHSIRDLPPRWTSGGLKNQRLRERGRISRGEYCARRNSFICSRGDKSKKGNLNTAKYRGYGARKIKGIPHHKLYHVLSYKFGEVQKRSEVYTSKMAAKISPQVGLDIHKVSAAMFALKVLNYGSWSSLKEMLLSRRGVRADEGTGSLSAGRTTGSEVTPLHQADSLVHNEATATDGGGGYSAIPGSWGASSFLRSMRKNLPCLQVKI